MVRQVIDKKEFTNILNANQLVLVDFFATWCGPCVKIAPQLEDLSQKYKNIIFLKVDVHKLQDLTEEYNVAAMPTFILFVHGKPTITVVGADIKKVEEALKKY